MGGFNHRVVTMVADKAKDTVVMYYIICCLSKTIGEDYLTTIILQLVTTEHLCEGVHLLVCNSNHDLADIVTTEHL